MCRLQRSSPAPAATGSAATGGAATDTAAGTAAVTVAVRRAASCGVLAIWPAVNHILEATANQVHHKCNHLQERADRRLVLTQFAG